MCLMKEVLVTSARYTLLKAAATSLLFFWIHCCVLMIVCKSNVMISSRKMVADWREFLLKELMCFILLISRSKKDLQSYYCGVSDSEAAVLDSWPKPEDKSIHLAVDLNLNLTCSPGLWEKAERMRSQNLWSLSGWWGATHYQLTCG